MNVMQGLERLLNKLQNKIQDWKASHPLSARAIKKLRWVLLLGLLILIPYWLSPKETTVYYSNQADKVSFTLKVREQIIFDVRSSKVMTGIADFENTSGKEATLIFDETVTGNQYLYSGRTTVESNGSYLNLKLVSKERPEFTCRVEVGPEEGTETGGNQDGTVNQIHIFDFPQDVSIIFNNGNNSNFSVFQENHGPEDIPDGEYQVTGIDSLYFYMDRPSPEDMDAIASGGSPEHMFGVDNYIESFNVLNRGRTVLEATVNGNTDFYDLGNIRISGESSEQSGDDFLRIKISDFGAYPTGVELSGVVKSLQIGNSFYNLKNLRQWMYENWDAVLLSVFGTLFAATITNLFSKKKEE